MMKLIDHLRRIPTVAVGFDQITRNMMKSELLLHEDRTEEVQFSGEDNTRGYATVAPKGTNKIEGPWVEITRKTPEFPFGTFGKLEFMGFECWTIELPWRNNAVNISCIPPGIYPLEKCMYYGGDGRGGKKDYPAYEIKNVPGRSHIKIHIAQHMDHIKGCMGVGQGFNILDKLLSLSNSKKTFNELMAVLALHEPKYINIKYLTSKGPWDIPT